MPQGPHELPPADDIQPNQPVEETPVQDTGEGDSIDAQAVQELYEATRAPEPVSGDPTPRQQAAQSRPRDENGRFIPQEPSQPDQPTEPVNVVKHDPMWESAAKDLGFTDEQINSLPPDLLRNAVVGRRYEFQQRYAPPQTAGDPTFQGQQINAQQYQQQVPQQQQPQVTPEAQALADFDLDIDEDVPEEYAEPLKKMAQKLGQIAKGVTQQNQELQQEVQSLKSQAQETEMAREMRQGAQQWDVLAQQVPGLVDSIGLPSAAAQVGTTEHTRWRAMAPAVMDQIGQFQQQMGYYPSNDTVTRILHQVATDLNFIGNNVNGNNGNGAQTMPGQVVAQSASRGSGHGPPVYTGDVEYDRSYATISNAWEANGGNPFA